MLLGHLRFLLQVASWTLYKKTQETTSLAKVLPAAARSPNNNVSGLRNCLAAHSNNYTD